VITRIAASVALGLLFAVAFLAGTLTYQVAYATNYLYLQLQGGTEAGTANVNCGWHDACASTSGNALDWDQGNGAGVYFTSYASYNSGSTIAGTASAAQDNGDCKRVTVSVKRPDGTALGPVYYVHSDVYSTSTFTVNAGASLTETQYRVATTAADTQTCINLGYWTAGGYHLHQSAGSPFGTHWSQFPYSPNTRNNVDVTSTSEYQQYVTFEY